MTRRFTHEQLVALIPEDCGLYPVEELYSTKRKSLWSCSEGHVFENNLKNIQRCSLCPVCSPRKVGAYTVKQLKEITKDLPMVFVDTWYKDNKHSHKFKCIKCNRISNMRLNSVLSGVGCNLDGCSRIRRLTFEMLEKKLQGSGLTPEYTYLKNCHTPVTVTCSRSEEIHTFKGNPTRLMQGVGCPVCACNIKYDKEYANSLLMKHNRDVRIIGEYTDSSTITDFECLKCNGVFTTNFNRVHTGARKCHNCHVPIGGFNPSAPAIMYYLEVTGNSNEKLYKIGITNRSVKERFLASDLMKIKVLRELAFESGQDAYNLEQYYLKLFNHEQYSGEQVLSSGNTELFNIDIFNLN